MCVCVPRCGPKKRWRDVICKDLDYIGVNEDKWYEELQDLEQDGGHCVTVV